ncbi:flagellar assembly peptidoglycan hydrolase FlgJ [Massilia terrae]|uniref:Peptidoglycan hydrolase FlgJ n=1 Tax=Massilia terrae TaxID=1811224 RepID=A0ABT2CYG9_9BURK|nr:flagellar assembly peptidoglycan hydrolase FlgJ [Massilia terrae]MCS0658118.1 flagellar assembly peptidoglycan hydrolase FlgJ [Massilia terrae]
MSIKAAAPDLSASLAFDTQSLGGLKQSAKTNSPDALKGAATQFEALFINMMLKSMRDATPQDGVLDSQESKTYTSMLDQQMSQTLAKRGIGLADMLVRQMTAQQVNQQALALSGEQGASAPAAGSASGLTLDPAALAKSIDTGAAETKAADSKRPPHVRAFREKLSAQADEAERATGIPAKFMLGQAALESGWGKREIKMADGSTSHNLFGIKAGPGWKGKVATAVTTEYINGKPHTKVEKFRAYDSYAEGFKDYAKMLASNPRYQQVLAHGGDAATFARGLQRAGYATDPQYAAKLTTLIKHSFA